MSVKDLKSFLKNISLAKFEAFSKLERINPAFAQHLALINSLDTKTVIFFGLCLILSLESCYLSTINVSKFYINSFNLFSSENSSFE